MRTALLGLAIGGCAWDTPQSTLIATSDFAREIHGLYFGSRRTFAAGMFPVTPESVATRIEDPPAVKPGAKTPALPLTKDERAALAAYLVSLK